MIVLVTGKFISQKTFKQLWQPRFDVNDVKPWMVGNGLNIVTLSHPCDRDIPFGLNIVTLSHPCDRDIPFGLNIKKPA
jgi:hypothetical protein